MRAAARAKPAHLTALWLVTEHEPIRESSSPHCCRLDVGQPRRCVGADPAAYDGAYPGVSAALLNPQDAIVWAPQSAADIDDHGRRGSHRLGTGPFNGPISPQGTIALKNDYQSRLNAQIDAQGNVKGTIGAQCTYDSVWRKR